MYLKHIWLHQYKNHSQLNVEFVEGINAIYGANGVGKTNILDAIHYLCNGKSYFTNTDSKVILKGENELSVRGIFEFHDERQDDITVSFNAQKKKIIKKNQKAYKRLIDHVGHYPVVMVTPTDVSLIYDDSKERRRFMDLVLCQTDSKYISALSTYKKILETRNKVLRQMQEKGISDATLLDGYTQKMAEPAQYILDARKEFTAAFIPLFEKAYETIAKEKSQIGFLYENDLMEGNIAQQLEKSVSIDIRAGRTTKGIHKDDLVFTLAEEPIKRFASQGQIKSFLIAIKIAQFDYLKEQNGQKPLLLLDDIFEKIDEERAQSLINMVSESHFGQIFITDTHESRLEKHIYDLKSAIKAIPLTHGQ
jgi:DNA replication and repair protein RecF